MVTSHAAHASASESFPASGCLRLIESAPASLATVRAHPPNLCSWLHSKQTCPMALIENSSRAPPAAMEKGPATRAVVLYLLAGLVVLFCRLPRLLLEGRVL